MPDAKERYTIKKVVSAVIFIISLGALLAVWIEETTTLVMAYGLLSAGIARRCIMFCRKSINR